MQMEKIYKTIIESSIFRNDGPDIDLCVELLALCEAINAEPEDSEWYTVGEGNEADMEAIVVGAYCALTEWHGGQASTEYATLCQLGTIYQPRMEGPPTPEESAYTAYELFDLYFKLKHA